MWMLAKDSIVKVKQIRQNICRITRYMGEDKLLGKRENKQRKEWRRNYNKLDHMIAAKRAWSLYKKKKAAFITWPKPFTSSNSQIPYAHYYLFFFLLYL